ncbi:T9SS type A sorting domain-containing protein [Candidatus Marinimicrobia bacterium]|jgi:hypothetical protein|nr:T9SS type A sorting domain-containing protein [Candidatus Neomarinimicrobiota bacterium]
MKLFLIFLLFFLNISQLTACRLWALYTKNNLGFSMLSNNEKSKAYNQLNSFFIQSTFMSNGWSILDYPTDTENNVSPIFRSEKTAFSDSTVYWNIIDSLFINGTGEIGLAHLRLASSGINSVPNPHPWMFYDNNKSYSFMHNGTVDKELLFNLITDNGSDLSWLNNNEPQTFDGSDWRTVGWQNVVDSELIMLYLAQQISERGDVYLGLQVALSSITNQGISAIQLNMIFSDGISLYCFGGSNGLSYTESDEHFAVMTQPENSGALNWTGIKNGELVVIGSSGLVNYPNFLLVENQNDPFFPENLSVMNPAYPNPFNSSVQFSFSNIPEPMDLNVSFYNLNGQLVESLLSRNIAENEIVKWIPSLELPSGTYFLQANLGNNVFNQKILFIK